MKCPNCGAENPPDARFCASCGTSFEAACANCGAALPPGARFCHVCGQPVAEGAAAEERKLVTVLFADVTGSTGLGERLDPERLKEVMGAYFGAMREEIEGEGGTVEKFIGDAVMAVFGVPSAHEDDPARGLRAALRMRRRLEELNDELTARYGVALEMRIGVNSGDVLAATEPRPGEGMVAGDTVNVAARLEQGAEPGQVLVGERTARATRGFHFQDLGASEVKGKGQPVRAFRLLGEEPGPERGVPGLQAPMVGRDRELELLASLYDRVAEEGRPHLATIYGDAGVGKSRLTAEFLQWAESKDPAPMIVRGRCLPYGEGITYWPLAEILKGVAGVLDTDPPNSALEKVRKLARELLTAELSPDPIRAAAALAYTVGVEDPENPFRDLAPRQVQAEAQAAWRSFFSGLAGTSPVVAVVEDIHWADPAMLDLLEDLSDRVRAPVFFVCPARPELTGKRSGWGGGRRNFSSVFLEPLSAADSDRLVNLLLSVEQLPDTVHDRILERAEGNPFFLEEIIRHLIDEGQIERADDRWRAAVGIEDVAIPDTIQAVLAARIDLLGREEKRALQSAAVVGRVFWPGPVASLLDGIAEELEDILDRLEGRELVVARLGSSMAGEREFIFKHVLTRDVAYESLTRRDRADAHMRVARWMEETLGDREREFVELLAYHYLEAHRGARPDRDVDRDLLEGLRRKAFENLLAASEDARSKMALSKAQTLAEDALAVAAAPRERALAGEAAGLAFILDYQGSNAWPYLQAAALAALEVEPSDRQLVADICSRAIEVPTRWPGSMQARPPESQARRLLDAGLQAASPTDNEARIRLLMAESMWPFGFPAEAGSPEDQERARESGEEAAAMARRLERPDLESAALDGYASFFFFQGLYGAQQEPLKRRLAIVDRLADPLEVGDTFSMVSQNHEAIGRYREALRTADEGYRRTVDRMPAPALHCVSWRALARFRLGDWDGVLEDVAEAERLLGDRSESPPYFTLHAFASALFVHQSRRSIGPADRLRAMLARILASGRPSQGAVAYMVLIEARRGDFAASRQYVEHPTWAETYQAARHLLLQNRCLILAWEEAWEEVPTLLAEARAHAERAGLEALPVHADRLEGRTAWATGEPDRAVQLLQRSRGHFATLEAPWEVALADLWLAEALATSGDTANARQRLEAAREVFERLGSLPELEQAAALAGRLG